MSRRRGACCCLEDVGNVGCGTFRDFNLSTPGGGSTVVTKETFQIQMSVEPHSQDQFFQGTNNQCWGSPPSFIAGMVVDMSEYYPDNAGATYIGLGGAVNWTDSGYDQILQQTGVSGNTCAGVSNPACFAGDDLNCFSLYMLRTSRARTHTVYAGWSSTGGVMSTSGYRADGYLTTGEDCECATFDASPECIAARGSQCPQYREWIPSALGPTMCHIGPPYTEQQQQLCECGFPCEILETQAFCQFKNAGCCQLRGLGCTVGDFYDCGLNGGPSTYYEPNRCGEPNYSARCCQNDDPPSWSGCACIANPYTIGCGIMVAPRGSIAVTA